MFLWYHPRGSVKIWGLKFIKSLIDLMHKQWLFQNSDAHYISKGLTANQHDELTIKIRELMKTKCNALLARHRHFMPINFNVLGSGPALARQVWVANMEMAISVAKVAKGNFCIQESIRLLSTPHSIPTTRILPSIPTTDPHTSINPATTSIIPNFVTPGSQSRKVRSTRSPYSKDQPHHQPSTNNHKRPLAITSGENASQWVKLHTNYTHYFAQLLLLDLMIRSLLTFIAFTSKRKPPFLPDLAWSDSVLLWLY